MGFKLGLSQRGRKKSEVFWEQGAKENVWAEEKGGTRDWKRLHA